jgi:glycosyltransferase involved in cell wall biosynthesis
MVHPHDINSSLEPWTARILYIAKEFAKKGHNIKLIYFPLERQKRKSKILQKNIIIIPLPRYLGLVNLASNILILYRLTKWANIVHFQKCFYYAAVPAITAALFRKKPIHYDWDDWEVKIYEVSTQPGIVRSIVRAFLNFLESIIPKIVDTISVSSLRLKIECERLGVNKSQIFDAHVGADIVRFNPKVSGEAARQSYNIEGPLVLYLGQLHSGQYVELFIKAASRIIHDYLKGISFMIVGDGYRAQELIKLTQRLNLDGKVIFTGAVSHDLVPQYIAAADVCVACFQKNEVTLCKSPLKVAEYMASGKAIVASNVGEVPNMIGEAGILIPPGDVDALAKAIINLIENEKLRKDKEKLARQRAEQKYNWTVVAENILKAYEKAIEMDQDMYNVTLV